MNISKDKRRSHVARLSLLKKLLPHRITSQLSKLHSHTVLKKGIVSNMTASLIQSKVDWPNLQGNVTHMALSFQLASASRSSHLE